jgi:hypothetical protein
MTTSKEPYYFIASPYNGTDEEKQYRYKISKKVATDLLKNHISVFAPILYNEALEIDLAIRRETLMPMNLALLHNSKGVILLKLESWDSSPGIAGYLKTCEELQISVFGVEFNDMEYNLDKLIGEIHTHSEGIGAKL